MSDESSSSTGSDWSSASTSKAAKTPSTVVLAVAPSASGASSLAVPDLGITVTDTGTEVAADQVDAIKAAAESLNVTLIEQEA